jgi:putative phage-type endonuclease
MSEIVQLSDEWKAIRLGKATASRMADICARTKTGWSTSRDNYKAQLVCERLTGTAHEGYQNEAMTWGIEKEPDARRAYEFMRDATVTEVGFVEHPTIAMSGASPDGLVGDDGLIEIKAPITASHIRTLLDRNVPRKYYLQIQFQLACTDRKYCDFVSYDPRLPESMQLFIDRVPRDDACIAQLEQDVVEFLAEVDATVAELRARYEGGPSPLMEALVQSVALEASP